MFSNFNRLVVVVFVALAVSACASTELKQENDSLKQARAQDQQVLQDYADKLRAAAEQSEAVRARSEADMAALRKELNAALTEKKVAVTRLEDLTIIEIGHDVLFESGQADLTSQGQAIVKEIAAAFKKYPDYHMRLEGHADNRPISKELKDRYPSNWELSAARAASVAKYMIYGLDVPGQQVSIAGYADHRPVASNDTQKGRAQNRRIRAVVFKQ